MKTNRKRRGLALISIILCIAMLLNVPAFAAGEEEAMDGNPEEATSIQMYEMPDMPHEEESVGMPEDALAPEETGEAEETPPAENEQQEVPPADNGEAESAATFDIPPLSDMEETATQETEEETENPGSEENSQNGEDPLQDRTEDPAASLTAVTKSGAIYTSQLTDNTELQLADFSYVIVDVDRTLTSISGNYALKIEGSHTLTIENPYGHGIEVNALTISSPVIISASEDGINAKKNIEISASVSITAGRQGIYTNGGNIKIESDAQITAVGSAVSAAGEITVSGDLTASSSDEKAYCISAGYADNKGFSTAGVVFSSGTYNITCNGVGIHTYAGDIILNGNGTILSKYQTAVVAASVSGGSWSKRGNAMVNGTLKLEGKEYGVVAAGQITFIGGSITISGSTQALISDNKQPLIMYPLGILEPVSGFVKGNTIVNSGGSKATYVRIASTALSEIAGVIYTSPARIGETVNITLTGELSNLYGVAPQKIHYQWQISKYENSGWSDITGAVNKFYAPVTSDAGKYLRITITADGYVGTLYGDAKRVEKQIVAGNPVTPMLQTKSPYSSVRVTNAKAAQEYVVAYSTNTQDWSKAKSPTADGTLDLPADPDKVVFLYTRMKETATTSAGTKEVFSKAYNGYVTYLRDLNLSQSTVTTKVGEVTALTVSPLPDDFSGWNSAYTVNWFVNGTGVRLYLDSACTAPVPLGTAVAAKTVYVKGISQTNAVQVGVQKLVGYSDLRIAHCTFMVADKSGNFVLKSLAFEKVSMHPGETVSVPYKTDPSPATVGKLSFTKTQGPSNLNLTSQGNGNVSISAPENAAAGDYFYEVKVDGASTPVKSAIQITVVPTGGHWAVCPSKNFIDVLPLGSVWYHEDVDYVVQKGYMTGISATSFAPNQALTRAMVVTILYRMAGEPTVSGTSGFSDVPSGKWFTNAITWAKNKGIATGYDAKTFGPNDSVTREQLVTFLYRYAGSPAPTGSVSGFSDAGKIGSWALNAMKWAVGKGIIKGNGDGTVNPKGNATRAQFAAMVHRYES